MRLPMLRPSFSVYLVPFLLMSVFLLSGCKSDESNNKSKEESAEKKSEQAAPEATVEHPNTDKWTGIWPTPEAAVTSEPQPDLQVTLGGEKLSEVHGIAYAESPLDATLVLANEPLECGSGPQLSGQTGALLGLWKRVEPDGSVVMTESSKLEVIPGNLKIANGRITGEFTEPYTKDSGFTPAELQGKFDVPVCPVNPLDPPEPHDTDLQMIVAGHLFQVRSAMISQRRNTTEVLVSNRPATCDKPPLGDVTLTIEVDDDLQPTNVRLFHQNQNQSSSYDLIDGLEISVEAGEPPVLAISGATDLHDYTLGLQGGPVELQDCRSQ